MKYTVIFEKIAESKFEGYYYAHIPVLDLTTHGLGIEGATPAAKELVIGWIEEKKANGEEIKVEKDAIISKLEIEDAFS